ncbi:MAG: hypothetical protein HFJ89_11100 [Oscillospiraceae bacterium]|jgi:hypothetical protein|nr:hypothetical protein [Oscillospiraceae bacterium]
MTGYTKMLAEYRQLEATLKKRIAELTENLKSTFGTKERTDIIRRKITIERELDDLEYAIYKICHYAEHRSVSKCRNG